METRKKTNVMQCNGNKKKNKYDTMQYNQEKKQR